MMEKKKDNVKNLHKKIIDTSGKLLKSHEKILDTSEMILRSPERLLKTLEQRRLERWYDKFEFFDIFMTWGIIVILFGVSYFAFQSGTTYLFSNIKNTPVDNLLDTVYFSFITATTTGFGDIVPIGGFKIVAMVEVIFGLILLAFVTSKLVSIKQDIILGEVYEISFKERINRLRSSLLVIRQHIIRMTAKAEDSSISHREIADIHLSLESFENILNEIGELTEKPSDTTFTKTLDSVEAEVIINGVISTFERISELIDILDSKKIRWRQDENLACLTRCISQNEALFGKIKNTGLMPSAISEIIEQKDRIIQKIKSEIKGKD